MSKRKKTSDNRPVSPPLRSSAPVNRGTIRVAHARREAVRQLPDVLFDKSRKSGSDTRPKLRSAQGDSPRRVEQAAAPSKPKAMRPAPRQLDLRPKADETCKSRPASSRGSGGSRAFVPWCKK